MREWRRPSLAEIQGGPAPKFKFERDFDGCMYSGPLGFDTLPNGRRRLYVNCKFGDGQRCLKRLCPFEYRKTKCS